MTDRETNGYPQDEDRYEDEPYYPRKRPRKKKKKSDPKADFILTQTVLCAIALLAVFMLKMVGGEGYRLTKSKYIDLLGDKTSFSEIVDTMFTVRPSQTPTTSQTPSDNPSADNSQSTSDPGNESFRLQEDNPISSVADGAVVQTSMGKGGVIDAGHSVVDSARTTGTIESIGTSVNTMQVPLKGTVTSRFGYRYHPITGAYLIHTGTDIAAPKDTPIVAAMSGTVKTDSSDPISGNYLIIEHGQGLSTLYAHCSRLIKAKGDYVKKGETIALVGSTGLSTGPHLHFEIRVNGVKINPEWILML